MCEKYGRIGRIVVLAVWVESVKLHERLAMRLFSMESMKVATIHKLVIVVVSPRGSMYFCECVCDSIDCQARCEYVGDRLVVEAISEPGDSLAAVRDLSFSLQRRFFLPASLILQSSTRPSVCGVFCWCGRVAQRRRSGRFSLTRSLQARSGISGCLRTLETATRW